MIFLRQNHEKEFVTLTLLQVSRYGYMLFTHRTSNMVFFFMYLLLVSYVLLRDFPLAGLGGGVSHGASERSPSISPP